MNDRYDPAVIEEKWQKRWEDEQIYRAVDFDESRPKWYALTMFPYPSGDIHTGHWYPMAPSDAAARYRRMQGYNVLFPMGFDSFGLPAENAAIKRGIDPREWTYSNIDRMRGQLRRMGTSFDWSREVITSDPEFYRWTQWWFLKLYEKGLAYRAEAAANWCPGCNTVLANEQVVDGRCERSDDVVERRFLTQWFFRITEYAEELLRFDESRSCRRTGSGVRRALSSISRCRLKVEVRRLSPSSRHGRTRYMERRLWCWHLSTRSWPD